jgi:CheY-like chemotaxis protein
MPAILIVEDHVDCAKALAAVCRFHGCESVVAGDVLTALTRLAEQVFDLVITDVHLPGASGIDFCRILCSAPADQVVLPVVVFSSDDLAREASLEAGAVAFYLKGRDVMAVYALIHRCGRSDPLMRSPGAERLN